MARIGVSQGGVRMGGDKEGKTHTQKNRYTEHTFSLLAQEMSKWVMASFMAKALATSTPPSTWNLLREMLSSSIALQSKDTEQGGKAKSW